jgi:hypothetical protein
MAAGSIIIDLLMKTGSFETDTKRAEKRLAELKKEAKAMGVAVGAAFAAVGTAAAYMVKSAIDAADEMGKAAQKAGVTVEEFSALAYAADLAGVSQEQLGSAMVKLSKNMSDAAMGTGEAVKGFDALGISVTNADGSLKSADQILAEVADKFAQMPDGVDKTTAAVNIFGRAGADLVPLLNGGSSGLAEMRAEAEQLGVVLSTETSKAAEEFNDNLSRMGAAVTGVANKAAGELLPALNEVADMLVTVAKDENSVSVATDIVKGAVGGLITVFQTIAVVGSDVGFVFMSVGREIGAWAAQIAALGRGDLAGFRAISDAVKADGERARAELDKFQARVMAIGQPTAAAPLGLDALRRSEIASAGGSRFQPRRTGTGGSGGGGRGRAPAAARTPKPFETSDRWDEDSAAAAEAQIMNEAQEAWAKYAEAVAKAEKPLEAANTQLEQTRSITEELGMTFTSAFEDAIIGGGKLSDVFKGLLQDVARVILRMHVIEPLMNSIMGKGGVVPPNPFAGGGGGGDIFSTIVGGISSIFGGFRASGGPVSAGQAYVVGERGPEMFVPRTAGAILPNHRLGGGGAPVTIVQNNTIGDVASMQKVRADLRKSEQRIAARVHRSRNYGGEEV